MSKFSPGDCITEAPKKQHEPVWYVYLIIDPRDDSVRYVGQTRDPEERYRAHQINTSIEMRRLSDALREAGLSLKLQIQAVHFDKKLCNKAEREWVKFYRNAGCDLINYDRSRASKSVNNQKGRK